MLSLLLLHVRCGKIGISGTAESGETLATQPPKRVPSWHFPLPPFKLVGFCSLFTFRGLLLCDTLTQRQPAAHERQEAVRFRRIAPYGAWTRQPARPHVYNLPCQEKALESLPRCSFPDRMCANQQPRRKTGAVFICRLSAVWSAARVCRHGWFDSKGGFYTPVAQAVEQRSPKPHVAGSSPAGSACVPYEGAAQ